MRPRPWCMSHLPNYQIPDCHPDMQTLTAQVMATWAPPPALTVSQWADQNRRLSPESSAEPGDWDTNRAPYQRGIMDALNDPRIVEVAVMSSAQVGKTEVINNMVGFLVSEDPCPILVIQPTVEMGKTWSKDRLAPMLRDTPALRGKVSEVKSRDGGNTMLHKTFPGGHITVAGANAPSGLASRPVRVVLCDEVDRYPPSAGTEGDPVNLAKKRAATFWNRRILLCSTPTVKGASRIETAYDASDQRRYMVPCPHCKAMQHLVWAQIQWDKDDTGASDPETARYQCIECDKPIHEQHKARMLRQGEWTALKPGGRIAGFHLNELYSPWRRWAEVVADFLAAKHSPETLKTWVNTSLGETWEDEGEQVDHNTLFIRREHYETAAPPGVLLVTAGIDTQDDRIEIHWWGWGIAEECWALGAEQLHGNPSTGELWKRLSERLGAVKFTTTNDHELRLSAAGLDTAGHYTQQAYQWAKGKSGILPLIGRDGAGRPILSRPRRSNQARIPLYTVGVDTCKELLSNRLRIANPGPGYVHLSVAEWCDEEWTEQLTAERATRRFKNGHPVRVWVKARARNEASDCWNYAYAAMTWMRPSFDVLAAQMGLAPSHATTEKAVETPAPGSSQAQRPRNSRRGGGFVGRWKN